MSRSYRQPRTHSDDDHDGIDDPLDIRYAGRPSRQPQPRVPPKPTMHWLPRKLPLIDLDWDIDD